MFPIPADIQNYIPFAIGVFFLILFVIGRLNKNIISNDTMVLKSERLGLIGRPDRIIKAKDGIWIPIEKKSSTKVQDSHRIQLGVYLILIEDITGKRPPHGYIALKDNSQKKILNSDKLRQRTWEHIEGVRAIKQNAKAPAKATPFAAKCAACGYKKPCRFAKI